MEGLDFFNSFQMLIEPINTGPIGLLEIPSQLKALYFSSREANS